MTSVQLREFLAQGHCTEQVKIADIQFVIKTLRSKELFAAALIRERFLASKPDATVDTFVSMDTAVKLSFALVEVDGKMWPKLSDEQIDQLVKSSFNSDKQAVEQIYDQAINNILKVLELPPQVLDKLSKEFNALNEKVQKALEDDQALKN